jgi:hypothetical protein
MYIYTQMPILVANTIFVSQKYGSDVTGVPEDPNFPFKTIQAAINKAITLSPTQGSPWQLDIAEGFYPENLLIPAWVNLNGVFFSVTVLSITMVGQSSVLNLNVVSTNRPALILQIPPNDPTAGTNGIFENVVFVTHWNVPSLTPVVAIRIISGTFSPNLCLVEPTFSATAPQAYSILCDDTIHALETPVNITIEAPIPKVTLIKSTGGQGVGLTSGLCEITIDAPVNDFVALDLASMPIATIQGVRFDLFNTSTISKLGFLRATGTIPFYMSGNTVNFAQAPFANQYSVQGIPDAQRNLPSVQLLNVGYAGQPFPPTLGSFSLLAYVIGDGNGSVTNNGGLNNRLTRVSGNYTVVGGDYGLLVTTSNAVITLPSNVPNSGQNLQIKNISDGKITVTGAIFDGDFTIKPNSALILQSDKFQWYIFGGFKGRIC